MMHLADSHESKKSVSHFEPDGLKQPKVLFGGKGAFYLPFLSDDVTGISNTELSMATDVEVITPDYLKKESV